MALALDPVATITYTLFDAKGDHAKIKVHIASTTTAAAAKTLADTLAGLIAAVTDCGISAYTISYEVEDPTPTPAVAFSSVEEKGRFLFQRANGLTSKVEVPAIKDAVLVSSGAVDMTNTDAAAFTNEIVTGGFVGPDGSDIASLYAAYRAFKGSTPNQLPSERLHLG